MGLWEFRLRVVTPDGSVLIAVSSRGDEYMDGSLLENSIYDLVHAAKSELDAKGYLS